MSKTVSTSKFREWQGLDRINQVAHEMNCIFREISKDDVGIDEEIEIVRSKEGAEGYETTGGILKVQAKSGTSYVRGDSADSFYTPVKKDDLEYWYSSTFPTLFIVYIVYHPGDDRLYWKEVKSYVREAKDVWKSPFKIHFDKSTDEFTPDCREQLGELAGASPPRISRQSQERLFSNLLPIAKLPPVWLAPTDMKSREKVRAEVGGWTPPYALVGDLLYSFEDLSLDYAKLRPAIDGHDVEKAPGAHLWEDDGF